jgi:hypothetical protein
MNFAKMHEVYGKRAPGANERPTTPTRTPHEQLAEQLGVKKPSSTAEAVRVADARDGLDVVSDLFSSKLGAIAEIKPHKKPPQTAHLSEEGLPYIFGATVIFNDEFAAQFSLEQLVIAINLSLSHGSFFKGEKRPLEIDPNAADDFNLAMMVLYIMAHLQIEAPWSKGVHTDAKQAREFPDQDALIDTTRIKDPLLRNRLEQFCSLLGSELMKIVRRELTTVLNHPNRKLLNAIQRISDKARGIDPQVHLSEPQGETNRFFTRLPQNTR